MYSFSGSSLNSSVGLWSREVASAAMVAAVTSRLSERPCSTLAPQCFLGLCFVCLNRGDHVGARHRLSSVRSLLSFLAASWFRYGVTEDAITRVVFLYEPKFALGAASRSSHVAADLYFILFEREPLPSDRSAVVVYPYFVANVPLLQPSSIFALSLSDHLNEQRKRNTCSFFGCCGRFSAQTGMGRTGKMWGYQNFDVEPDVITSAKVSRAMPCSCFRSTCRRGRARGFRRV